MEDPINSPTPPKTFKGWFDLQNKNYNIIFFIVSFGALIYQLTNLKWCLDNIITASDNGVFAAILTTIGMLTPLIIVILIVWKGFIQMWQDVQSGKSR